MLFTCIIPSLGIALIYITVMAKQRKITPEDRLLIEKAAAPLPTYPKLNNAKDGFNQIKYSYKGHQLTAMGIKDANGKPINPQTRYSVLGYDMQKPYGVLEKAFLRKGKAGLKPAIESYMQDFKIAEQLLKAIQNKVSEKGAITEE